MQRGMKPGTVDLTGVLDAFGDPFRGRALFLYVPDGMANYDPAYPPHRNFIRVGIIDLCDAMAQGYALTLRIPGIYKTFVRYTTLVPHHFTIHADKDPRTLLAFAYDGSDWGHHVLPDVFLSKLMTLAGVKCADNQPSD